MAHDPKRVIIVGCGGIGTWLAHAVGRTLEFQAPGSVLVLVDGDNFEEKNVERQMFEQLGNKAHALRSSIQDSIPNTWVIAQAAWVVPEDQVAEQDPEEEENVSRISPRQLMNEGDWVFAVVDNFAARKIILDAASEYDDIDVLVGGNGSPETGDPLYGTVCHYRRRNGQDVTIHPGVMHDEFVNPPDKNPGELSCAERAKLDGGTQLLAANLGVATQMVAKVSQAMFGTPEQEAIAMANAEICFDMSQVAVLGHDRRTEYGLSLEKAESKQYADA